MLIERHIVQAPGETIGTMTAARWEEFFRSVQATAGYPATMDWQRAYTLQFVKAAPR